MTQKMTSLLVLNLQAQIETAQEKIERQQKIIKSCRETLDEEVQRLAQEQRRIEFEQVQERGRKWKEEHPEEHAAFLAEIRERNRQDTLRGAELGWWDVDDQGNMLAPPIVVDSAKLPENAVMAHVMAEAGIFPSISQARKNGWDKPLTKGMFTVTKKKIRIKVV